MAFSRGFRPTGVLLVIFEVVFTITDPPMRFLRRFIPPLRLGGIAIDLSFLLLFIVTQIAIQLVESNL
jgi:YggT family protein